MRMHSLKRNVFIQNIYSYSFYQWDLHTSKRTYDSPTLYLHYLYTRKSQVAPMSMSEYVLLSALFRTLLLYDSERSFYITHLLQGRHISKLIT